MAQFNIIFGDKVVGSVRTDVTGLYTTFYCICHFKTDAMYRIVAVYGQREIPLGLCIPQNGTYTLQAKIPTKHLSDSLPTFYVKSDKVNEPIFITEGEFYGCEFLKHLMVAKLETREGKRGILIPAD